MNRVLMTFGLLISSSIAAQVTDDLLSPPVLPDTYLNQSVETAPVLHAGLLSLVPDEIDRLLLADGQSNLSLPSIDRWTGNEQSPLVYRPVSLFAPQAVVRIIGDSSVREFTPEGRLYYLATNHSSGVGIAVDPQNGSMSGFIMQAGQKFEVQGFVDGPLNLQPVIEAEPGSNSCSTELQDQPIDVLQDLAEPFFSSDSAAGAGETISYQAVVAVETDTEWLEGFGNDEEEALLWIADTFLAMNVFYERDVETRLLIGDVFLRVGPDAYTEPSNRFDQLNEFGEYWMDNMDDVDREFATMFSGRNIGSYSFSGIAWINQYCDYGHPANGGRDVAGSYSYNAIGSNRTPGNTAQFIGHELGHNMGSTHTHCYNPPVDNCYNGESGCYSGTPQCPAGGRGTVMSYCHVGGSNGAGCGSNSEFHPTVQGLLESRLSTQMAAGCIAPFEESEPTPVFSSNPSDGSAIVFGDQLVFTQSGQEFIQVSNAGTADLSISSCSLSGSQPGSFSVGGCPTTITPSSSSAITLQCNPQSVGDNTATLTVSTNDPDSANAYYLLVCNGTAPPAPEFDSSPPAGASLDFGSQEIGTESANLRVDLTNSGDADLVIDSCELLGTDSGDFVIRHCPDVLGPSGGDSVRARCAPQSLGALYATLRLTTNDTDEGTVDYPLLCNGTPPPEPEFQSNPSQNSLVDLGNTFIGQGMASQSIEIINMGGATLMLTSCQLSGPDSGLFTVAACPGAIPVGGSAEIVIQCAAGSPGEKFAFLTVLTNDSDESTAGFNLRCNGIYSPEDDDIFIGGFEGATGS